MTDFKDIQNDIAFALRNKFNTPKSSNCHVYVFYAYIHIFVMHTYFVCAIQYSQSVDIVVINFVPGVGMI